MIFPTLYLSNNLEEKKRKRKKNINIDLAVLPSHNTDPIAPPTDTNLAMTSINLEPSAILYQANQSADPTLWNGTFSSISLFGTIKVLEGDAKNIAYSLQRIATFIKQRSLSDRDGLDIPQISDFGFAAWDLISAIYNSGWDKLVADNNSRTFCQCVAL